MAKAIKLKNDIYLDTRGSVHNGTILKTYLDDMNTNVGNVVGKVTNIESYLNDLIRVVDISTGDFNVSIGGRYRGAVRISIPDGYKVIAIIPSHTTYGDRNFTNFNYYYNSEQIYYEIYVQWDGDGKVRTNFRIILIKNNIS